MTKGNPEWEKFELHAQSLLGLRGTIASGTKWYDPGDGTSEREGILFPFMTDAKCTRSKSWSVSLQFLEQWTRKSSEFGKRFLMPLRFITDQMEYRDYVILTLDDFAEIVEAAEEEVKEIEVCQPLFTSEQVATLYLLAKGCSAETRSTIYEVIQQMEQYLEV